MPRECTFPDTVEQCRTITMTDLKRLGFLTGFTYGPLRWTTRGEPSGSVTLQVQVLAEPRFIRLMYSTKDLHTGAKQDFDYKIPIEVKPTNLGKGERYYFLCPRTGKRCMTLYEPPGATIFAHRDYWQGLYYRDQLQPKRWRKLGQLLALEDRLNSTETRYMKTHYRGKVTPRYQAYLDQIKKVEDCYPASMRTLIKMH